MAPSNGDQVTNLRSESLEKSVTAHDGECKQISQVKNQTTFHCYVHLPFELRAQIRTAAIEAAYPNSNPWKWPNGEKPCSRLASVSKEWKGDVEKVLFGEIRIDPSNEEDVARFKELFTDERKRFLTRLDIAIDGDEDTGPWHKKLGLLGISQVMEKIGQFFQFINAWNFCRDGEKQQSIEIIFTAPDQSPGHHSPKDKQPQMSTTSLWEKRNLNLLTGHGLMPANVALWAIKSEFPSSLNMVTHLTFLPDCLPLPAARKIIQAMPNLETCVLEVTFGSQSEEGWRDFTDFIHQLRDSAPSLRKLMLNSQNYLSQSVIPPSMAKFAASLRDYSQSLEFLRVQPFDLHPAFFLPFSEEHGLTDATSKWRWPRLQEIELGSFSEMRDWDPGQLTLSPADILIAAGKAAMTMPMLKAATIEAAPGQYFYIGRELSNGVRDKGKTRMCLAGFDKCEEPKILAAWTPFLGAEATLVEEKTCKPLPPMRIYEPLAKDEAGS